MDDFYTILTDESSEAVGFGEMGVVEFRNALGIEEAIDYAGYLIEDFSGDGIPELMIGEKQGIIFAMFTVKDGEIVPVLESWYRSAYRWLEDGNLFYQGSGGAVYSAFGTFKLEKDGSALKCVDFYFTDHNKEYEPVLYRNQSGVWDANVSEKWDMDEEAFWKIGEESREHIVYRELTPFVVDDSR